MPPRAARNAEGVHAIVGDKAYDSYLGEQALHSLLAAALGPESHGAVQALRGEETSWVRVLDAARMRSLFAEKRAVVVRNADALKGEADDLDAYLDDPTPGVTLVFMAAKPDKRRVAWKKLLERASVVKAEPLKGGALRGYVLDQLRKRRLALSEPGIEELLERVGQDLRRLIGELEKLEAFAASAPGRALSAEDVASVLGKGMAWPLYKLGDAFMARRAGEVLDLMEESLEEGEPPLRILAALHRVVRQLRGARALREARAPRDQFAARLQIMPFKVQDLLNAERQWSESSLRKALEALGRADRRMKSGGDAQVALTDAVAAACEAGATSRRTAR